MSNPFAKMKASTTAVSADTDSLGGARLLDTGVVDMTIKVMYAIESKGGAAGVVVEFEGPNKSSLRMTEYVSSGDEKGNKNFYIDQTTNEEKLLPGYLKVDGLCLLATELELDAQTWEDKLVPIWNNDAKAEVNTKVPVAVSMIGKVVKVGVHRIIENKTVKNEVTKKYDPINEEREINEVNKVFHAVTGKTIQEYREKVENADFLAKWQKKFGNETINRYKTVVGGATGGAPAGAGGGGKPTESLF